jgi:hypothetical protein
VQIYMISDGENLKKTKKNHQLVVRPISWNYH